MVVLNYQFNIHFIRFLHHECHSKKSSFPKGNVFLDTNTIYCLIKDQSVPHFPFIDKFSNLHGGSLLQICRITSIKSLVTKINPYDPIVLFSQNLSKTNFKLKLTYLPPNVLRVIQVFNCMVPIMFIGNPTACLLLKFQIFNHLNFFIPSTCDMQRQLSLFRFILVLFPNLELCLLIYSKKSLLLVASTMGNILLRIWHCCDFIAFKPFTMNFCNLNRLLVP